MFLCRQFKDKILERAEAISADLIIIGSRRPSISTYLLGSTAAAVVRYAKTSVLVVRWHQSPAPAGFTISSPDSLY